ncbi:helix-turn-helix domain-containing protein [Streptomyces sp. NPDC053086]|uniref:transcriptional regulator n=1 Tax=unclassified Streptomyces TaxID=2593676 RepID=UPI0037D0E8B8
MSQGTSEGGFAELLGELKNRSGHSYGTLAKRLHMSTSTLHRYCNGDAVPTDYAPVERLARLCKATPEELVELHRRWVLADAGRGRKGPEPVRKPGPGAGPGPGTGPEPGPGPGPGAEPEAGAVSVSGSGSVPASEPGPGTVPVSRSGSVPASEPEPVSEPVSEGAPEGEPVPVPGVASAPRPATGTAATGSRRRRTVLLAALTVTALLGTVAVALNLPSDGGRPDGKGATVDVRAAARDSAPVTPTAGSPTPSGSTTPSASPSAKAPATRSSSGTPARRPSASGTRRTSPVAAPPLTVTTHPYAWESPCSQHYLIDRPSADVSPPPLEQDAPAWVDVHHAVSAGEQYVTFTVQGTGEETVVLEGLSVRMAGKRSPLAWNDYAMGYPGVGCGGGVPTRSFTVALDAMRPAPVPEAGNRNFPFKVSQSDPEVFHVTADASAYDVSWYLELTWSSGSRHGILLIDDAGRPFRTSGNNGRPAYAFPLGGEKWQPASDAG